MCQEKAVGIDNTLLTMCQEKTLGIDNTLPYHVSRESPRHRQYPALSLCQEKAQGIDNTLLTMCIEVGGSNSYQYAAPKLYFFIDLYIMLRHYFFFGRKRILASDFLPLFEREKERWIWHVMLKIIVYWGLPRYCESRPHIYWLGIPHDQNSLGTQCIW